MKDIKGCVQLSSKYRLFTYIWFSVVNTAEEASSVGLDYCGTVQTNHKVFFVNTLEKINKGVSGRVLSCYEYYSKSFCLYISYGHFLQVKI